MYKFPSDVVIAIDKTKTLNGLNKIYDEIKNTELEILPILGMLSEAEKTIKLKKTFKRRKI